MSSYDYNELKLLRLKFRVLDLKPHEIDRLIFLETALIHEKSHRAGVHNEKK